MIVHKHYYRDRQSGDARIVVIPGTAHYAQQMETLHRIAYDYVGYSPSEPDARDECLTADKFRHHLRLFPEGQFIALDAATRQAVGGTVSMRMGFDPARPMLEPWVKTTDFG